MVEFFIFLVPLTPFQKKNKSTSESTDFGSRIPDFC